MCGRYHVNDETAREIEKLIRQINKIIRKEHSECGVQSGRQTDENIHCGDIYPTAMAPVIVFDKGEMRCEQQRWGFPKQQGRTSYKGTQRSFGNQVIFNARCETAIEKPTFQESIRHRRAVIPAAWFYEWSREKEKNIFYRKEQPVLFMAGCFKKYEDYGRFVILTTEANASMQPVHDRMPLVLEREEIVEWLTDDSKTEKFLYKIPCLLERRTDYQQMSLFS